MLLINLGYIVLGLIGLYYGGDWLVNGASRIALALRVSPLFIGLTVVAIGTSVPELVVSVLAALDGSPGLALGNVVGSNIANIGLILGLTGIVHVIAVKESLVKREIPILIGITFFATALLVDGVLSRLDGLLMLVAFAAFTALVYFFARRDGNASEPEALSELDLPQDQNQIRPAVELGRIIIGSLILIVGARLMVTGARNVASSIGVSDFAIGVTMVAFGTSLPELATSLTAAFRGENDIAVGNIIGSNVANLLLVLGSTSTIASIQVGQTGLSVVEYLVMIGFALLLLPFARGRVLSRVESAIFLGSYLAFIVYSVFLAPGHLPIT